jgi:hypothetical protein
MSSGEFSPLEFKSETEQLRTRLQEADESIHTLMDLHKKMKNEIIELRKKTGGSVEVEGEFGVPVGVVRRNSRRSVSLGRNGGRVFG